MTPDQLTNDLKRTARELGFSLVGVCDAATPPGLQRFDEWLAAGFAGEMDYLAGRRAAYEHPDGILPGVRSLLMLATDYATVEPRPVQAGQGRISRYAWSDHDYHDVIHDRLKRLISRLRELVPGAAARGVVDTTPLLEREFAQLAGLGWVGKHTLLLNRQQGSWFFLAALLTDVELLPDAPFTQDHCGTCRACLDACPTDAFPQPYVLDATRCISYLTIELKQQIPTELRAGLGDWLFGCDVCQEVCPWNRHAPSTTDAEFQPHRDHNPIALADLFALDDEAFRQRFRRTPLWRPRRRGILRNAAIVLGNQGNEDAVPALGRGLNDTEPLIRGAAAWALGRIGRPAALQLLGEQSTVESDKEVRKEIEAALSDGADVRKDRVG